MTTLEFRDELVTHKFTAGNRFNYTPKKYMNFLLTTDTAEEPFILRAKLNGSRVHGNDHIAFSGDDQQLGRRIISNLKLKEILDSARMPLIIRQANKTYLVGKGFLASYSRNRVQILFVACSRRGGSVTNVAQVKLYVSRELYTEPHKRVAQVIKGIVGSHTGDVVITRDIMSYLGARLSIASSASLRDKRAALDEIFDATVERKKAS